MGVALHQLPDCPTFLTPYSLIQTSQNARDTTQYYLKVVLEMLKVTHILSTKKYSYPQEKHNI